MKLAEYFRIIAHQPRPGAFLLATLLMRCGISPLLRIRRPGFELKFFPSSLSRALWLDSQEREGDAATLRACLRPDDIVIDVGANIGALALCAAICVGRSGRVHAIEAHPRTAGFLRENVAINRAEQIVVHHCALGDQTGTLRFSDRRSDDQNGVVTHEAAGGITVPVRKLDELLADELDNPGREFALLKIDVEGYELPVLRGAERVLARTRLVYFEAWDRLYARYGYTTGDVFDLLRGAGFGIYQFDPARSQLSPYQEDSAPEVLNLLAVRVPGEFETQAEIHPGTKLGMES